MEASPLLAIFVLLAATVVFVPLARVAGLGTILGYLAAGVLVGPYGLKLVSDSQAVRDVSEFGIVMMLGVSGLAALYDMSFAAVQKHVAVLERAALVTKEQRGRERFVRVHYEGLQRARRLLDEYEAIWRQRAERIADILAEE